MFDGDTIEPSVSVPTPTAARFAAIAAPVPELDPDGLRSSAYGFFVCPPRPLQPLVECVERKFAHSLRFVLPRITAPASRRRATMKASFGGLTPTSASEPAVVIIRSAVAMLSLISTGMPCSGPADAPALRSASSWSAIVARVGIDFDHAVERRAGAIDGLDPREILVRRCDRDVSWPDCMRCCRSAIGRSRRDRIGRPWSATARHERCAPVGTGGERCSAASAHQRERVGQADQGHEPAQRMPPGSDTAYVAGLRERLEVAAKSTDPERRAQARGDRARSAGSPCEARASGSAPARSCASRDRRAMNASISAAAPVAARFPCRRRRPPASESIGCRTAGRGPTARRC